DLAGPPLGLVEGYTYPPGEVTLRPGDCLLLYTDGVTDALDGQNKAFATKGVRAAVLDEAATGVCRPDVVGARVLDAVRRHAAGRPQYDDIALVCFGRLDPTVQPL